MKASRSRHLPFVLCSILVAAVCFLAPGAAPCDEAQDTKQPQAGSRQDDGDSDQGRPVVTGQVSMSPPSARPAYWAFIAGYEGDTHDMAYSFAGPSYNRPLNDNLTLVLRVFGKYLNYEFDNGDGTITEVSSPGFGPSVGLRWGRKNWFKASTGLDVKFREETIQTFDDRTIREENDTRVGATFGAETWLNPGRNNVHGQLHYSTADNDYIWGRLAAKRQLSNFGWRRKHTFYLGVEGIGQGNEDVTSWQGGGLAEILFVPSQLSLMVRGGYKHSSFDLGPDKTGPYFGVGLYKRF